ATGVANALTGQRTYCPKLVTINAYQSAEIAAAVASAGASICIGFLAQFNDAAGEVFFTQLYRTWADAPNIERAIATALAVVMKDPSISPSLEAAPIVIWSRQPVTQQYTDADKQPQEPALTRKLARPSFQRVRGSLQPYLEFPADLNYCGLHNSADPF